MWQIRSSAVSPLPTYHFAPRYFAPDRSKASRREATKSSRSGRASMSCSIADRVRHAPTAVQ